MLPHNTVRACTQTVGQQTENEMSQENKRRIWLKGRKIENWHANANANENEMVYCVILGFSMKLDVSKDAKSSTDRELAKQTAKNFHFTLFQLNLRPNYLNGREWKVSSFDEDKFKCNILFMLFLCAFFFCLGCHIDDFYPARENSIHYRLFAVRKFAFACAMDSICSAIIARSFFKTYSFI